MEPVNLKIQEIAAEETYPIRQIVLRPGKSLEEVAFPGDTDVSSFHLGAFANGKLIGATSFMKNSHSAFPNPLQFQMRGMAILPEAQGMGIGKKLLLRGEKIFNQREDTELLWFNARSTAVQFYEKFGYVTHGDFFEIPNISTHIIMYKLV